jgi:hypothetical protein
MGQLKIVVSVLTVAFACLPALYGQDSTENPETGLRKHFTFGVRVRDFPLHPLSAISNQTTMTTTTTTTPPQDWSFTTASKSPWWGVGLALEYAISQHWTVSADVMMNRLHYTQATTVTWGVDDPTTTTDERSHMFLNEDTRATLFDVPILAHYRGLFGSGPLSNVFVSAGAAVRAATKVKSSTLITYPDATTAVDQSTTSPSKRILIGAVAGVGIRVVDDFHIVWTPEIRYTRWDGSTFSNESTISPRNQLEIALGFTF